MDPINHSTSPVVFWWKPACWLRVSGDDVATFLQGQFTNELRGVPAGAARYGLWLSVKGKVLADSHVLRGEGPNEFWVGSYFSPAATIRERLENHIIADDVMIEDLTGNSAAVSVWETGGSRARPPEGWQFEGRRGGGKNSEWIFPLAARDRIQALFSSAREWSAEDVERARIAAGIPAIPADAGPGDLPNEAGLDRDAISFTKGCYLGQEVMARLKSMGQVRRRLLAVQGDGEAIPALPARLFAGPRAVGELRSAARDGAGGWIGLAMLSLLQVKSEKQLALAPEGPAALRLMEEP